MAKKLTITLDDATYEGLRAYVPDEGLSEFFTGLIQSLIRRRRSPEEIEAGYRALAEDSAQEEEMREWRELFAKDMAPKEVCDEAW